MRSLSKSKLIAFRQCPKRLWLEVHRPELREDSAATQVSFANGHRVGELARAIYDPEGSGEMLDLQVLGLKGLLARTRSLVAERRAIFEAGFENGDPRRGALALADVLKPDGDGVSWHMVEVKSSTSVKDYYLDDAAIQYHVATASGVKLSSVHIAHVDSSWTYAGDSDYRGLLVEEDVTSEAQERQPQVVQWLSEAHEVVSRPEPPDRPRGRHCAQPFACGFEVHCRQAEDAAFGREEYPIEWLPGRRSQAFQDYVATNSVRGMRRLPDGVLNTTQLRVKRHTVESTTYFDAEGAAGALATHSLPALFLDFETIAFVVPIWAGTRPYEQIPFQFSLHRLCTDGVHSHAGFLDLSGADPSERIAQALVASCGATEPIFAYNKSFESGRLQSLAARFPSLASRLRAIDERLVDLLPVANRFYYHPAQQGSWSIKSVLPTIAPELDYADLEGVQDGGAAQSAYLEAINPATIDERRSALREQLWRYCRLDTYGMVRLWAHFSGRPCAPDTATSVEVTG
jgi:CRISPR/Cas system-associated exonuclease Cas4 (RecB family)